MVVELLLLLLLLLLVVVVVFLPRNNKVHARILHLRSTATNLHLK